MTASERWLLAAAVFVLAALWPASQLVGLVVLLFAAVCLRMSRDTA